MQGAEQLSGRAKTETAALEDQVMKIQCDGGGYAKILTIDRSLSVSKTPIGRIAGAGAAQKESDVKRLIFSEILIRISFQLEGNLGRMKPKGSSEKRSEKHAGLYAMGKLQIISGPMKGQAFDLQKETIFLGRSSKNDIRISDRTLSRKQLKIFRIGGKFFVEDLKSTNGTCLNGNPILPGEGFELDEGDIISMGETQLRAEDLSVSPFPTTPTRERGKGKAERRHRPARYLEPFCRISELIRDARSERETCFEVLNSLIDHLPRIDRAAILILGHGNKEQKDLLLRTRAHEGDAHLALSRKVLDDVIKEGRAIRMSNTFYEAPDDLSESLSLQIRCVICVPILRKGRMLGALYVDSLRMPHGFRKDDLLLLKSLSGPIALLVERGSEMGGWPANDRGPASDWAGLNL
jgi:hypothetical protein